MNAYSSLATLLVASALLIGCSSNSSDNSDLENQGLESDQTSIPAPGTDPNGGPQPLTQYNGNYLYDCTPDGEVSVVQSLTIQDDVATSINQIYKDAECTQPDRKVELTLSIVYPGGTTDTPIGTADHIDLTVESFRVNDIEPTIEELRVAEAEGLFVTIYSIILLDGAMLYTGAVGGENDGSSPDTRATELEPEALIRQ